MIDHSLYVSKDHLSPSSLSTFARCPRRYFYRSGCRLQSPGKIPAIVFGEAIHHGMPFAQRLDADQALAAFDKVWSEELADKKRCRARAETLFRTVVSNRKGSIYTLLPPVATNLGERISQDEVPFAVDVGIGVPLVGRIDAIAQHRDFNTLWGVEYKTSSEFSTRFFEGFILNPQTALYTLALNLLTLSSDYKGVIVEGLQVAITSCKTLAYPIRVGEQTLADAILWCKNIWEGIQKCEAEKEWPKNIGQCTPYPGFAMPGYACDYQSLCLAEDWLPLVGLYERVEEQPFETGGKQWES